MRLALLVDVELLCIERRVDATKKRENLKAAKLKAEINKAEIRVHPCPSVAKKC
jgi:hypothetical protein